MKIYYTEFNSNCISVIVESFKKIGFTLLDRTIKLIQENLGDDAFLVAIDDGNDDNIVKYIIAGFIANFIIKLDVSVPKKHTHCFNGIYMLWIVTACYDIIC